MSILSVIKEEINGFKEGTGDRYAEKRFGIPDDISQWEKQADQSRFDSGMGEHVGYTFSTYNQAIHIPIFKNPQSLKNFDAGVRAVSDADGNVFVAQQDGDYVHGAFAKVMGSDPYDYDLNITWHRIDNTNIFGYSDSFWRRGENQDTDLMERMLELKRKQVFDFRLKMYDSIYDDMSRDLNEAGYHDDEGVIKLYHRVGVKNASSYPELIKSVQQRGLVTNDSGEIGDAIWFSNDFKDYGESGMFVVSLDFDTATNGVANNKYGIVYQGQNAYAHENIPFEDLEVVKIPVGIIGHDHVLTNIDAIKYINDDGFLTPEAIKAGEFKIVLYQDVFNTYVQPHINIPDFLNQVNDANKVMVEQIIREEIDLMEVGEGGHQAYPWQIRRAEPHNYDYVFQTEDGDNYEVMIMDIGNHWNADFKIIDSSFEQVVNKGRFFNVMATVGDVIKDFLIKVNPELLRISPAKNSQGDQRRLNIYMQFISKQLPRGYEGSTSGGYIYIQKVDELQEIIREEIALLEYPQQGVYTIPDLARVLEAHGHDEQAQKYLAKMLWDAYKRGGDPAVVEMYAKMAGVQIEAVRNGRYMFANLTNPVNHQGLEEVQDNSDHRPDEMPS